MTDADRTWVRVGADELRHDGYLRVVRRRLRMPDGTETDWDLLDSVDSVVVLPLTDDGRVVCVRQYRPGPDAVVTGLPGGLVEDGEDVAATAARELLEETGWQAASVEVVASSQWIKSTETCWTAVARGCTRVQDQDLDAHEDIEVVILSVAQVRAGLRSGTFHTVQQAYQALDAAALL